MTNITELKEKLTKRDENLTNEYIGRQLQEHGQEPTYKQVCDNQYFNYDKTITALLSIIEDMQQALRYYHSNAMTFKHCQEISPDVEEYCNGEIAEDTLTTTEQKLKELTEEK